MSLSLGVLVITCILGAMAACRLKSRERLAERRRIARELHDTLLQGFLSASMHVQVASDALPADSPAKPMLARALQLMRQGIEEGRDAVQGLRSSDSRAVDLSQAFSRIRQELEPEGKQDQPVEFRVVVDGQPRPLDPLLRNEVYRIGREALINAFRHSGANHIEIEIEYSSQPASPLRARRWFGDKRENGRGGSRRALGAGGHAGEMRANWRAAPRS